ncbi:membrane protease YdiL (CAAX protease family) [Microbacterium sp. SORGH_AS428]|uniref:CPBP family intramembrane glutamic endopeptidase n=1 Tax=Microbacterium sp. SORGH_AS_0428 TaxID=3041788 RepID=UPI00285CB6C6|nr:CPBP family intramembrane glutamic endopeptidase [Microbacterium sp. SORGH_AS_0428]MDR6200223.1 membrane protease YdiL (CAAX protease family) [Microbacterium sp. SORGH_AS_0428]
MTPRRPACAGSRRPRILPFVAAFAVIVMGAVAVATLPVFAGADPAYLTWSTPLLQWVPFAAVLLLHGIYRRRHRSAVVPDGHSWTMASATAVRLRGRGPAVIRTLLLALAALVAVCVVPVLVAGAAGFIELRWADGAALAVLLTLPVSLIFMIPVAGEELAWRGYLTTLLAPKGFAFTTGLIAALWALWHLPLTLAYAYAGELAGRDVVSKTVDLLLAAVLVSALRYLSGSVWPAVFAHALFNNLFQMVQYNFMAPLSEASTADYWSYMALCWTAWIVVDALLVTLVMRRTRGALAE